MTVLLNRAYAGVPAGQIATFTSEVEASLIAQQIASANSKANTSTGPQTQNSLQGTVAAAAGQASITVTNNLVDANSHITAQVAQVAADGTALRVERIVPAAGSFTIYLTGAATATTIVDWQIVPQSGMSQRL